MKKTIFSLILIVLLLAFTLAGAEIILRLATTTDENDNVFFKGRQLLPYRFPVNSTRHRLRVARELRDEAYVVDHPLLGWTLGPDRESENGLYATNSRGIRSAPREYPENPEPGTLRIALFGDSFTHGDEEPWFNTWADKLERYLNRDGVRAEVLNFGVGGYCFSQAYLRWLHYGRDFNPRIVVIGFQAENMRRIVNVFRSLYSPRTWLVFSKPRHIINREGELELINSPVVPPEEVPGYLEDFPRRPLARYEFWFNPANYRAPFWTRSRLGQVIHDRLNTEVRDRRTHREMAENGGTPEEVTLALVKAWSSEIEADGGIPIVVHLPRRDHLRIISRDEIPAYFSLFEQMREAGIPVVDPAPAMRDDRRGIYRVSHYSVRGSRLVAAALAESIEDILRTRGKREKYRRPPPVVTGEDLLEQARVSGEVEIAVGEPGDELYIREGFHNRELYQGRFPSRWTRGEARLRLPLALPPGTPATLEVRLAAWGPPGNSLRAELDGSLLEESESGDRYRRFRIPPMETSPRLADLTLSGPTWSPAEVSGSPDPRRLGVMIDLIRVVPDPGP